MNRTIAGVFLLALLCCGPLAAQRRFTLDVTGGVTAGGLRDEMFSPLNYAPGGFAVGLGGQYRFGKSQVGISLSFGHGNARSGVSDHFGADYYGLGISGHYLRNAWQPSEKLALWCGGLYRFGLDGMIWQMSSYTYTGSHTFAPQLRLEWEPAQRHEFSMGLSFYLLGWVLRPPYNYIPNDFEEIDHSYFWYLMRQLRKADFALIGRYWDVGWEAEYHYRISPRFLLGLRYAFRYQRYPRPQPFTHYDNQVMISAKIRL